MRKALICCVVVIEGLYLVSFLLPWTGRASEVTPGWRVVVRVIQLICEDPGNIHLVVRVLFLLANPLVWIGAVCLWARRPHFAMLAGAIASGIAIYILYITFGVIWDGFAGHVGLLMWTASMVLLTASGLVFTIRQWRQMRRLPMVGEM